MSQLKLIANDESAEDLCDLIKALHTEMVEMRAEMQRGFDVLLAVKGDDTEALRAMIVSAPAAVVPFEDETAPVVAPADEAPAVAQPTPRKKPTFWSKQCPIARAHNSTVQSARKMQKLLKSKLASDKLSPSERAAYESRLIAEQKIESEHKGHYNEQLKRLGYVHPNKAKRAAAKATK